jgi:hypothetical protein
MTQTLYAHMNKKKRRRRKLLLSAFYMPGTIPETNGEQARQSPLP